ncbi:MAG: MBL fold metallo-hydrolase, partial [Clostridiales bacterium]|nr:MBL fold metallo-hydrolase [Clostridiales bacterium]
IKGADVLIIESNHDVEMLRNGPYPYPLQRRILSRYGHMSNDQCADTIEIAYQYGTRNFLLAHVSLNNNTFEMALKTAQKKMEDKDVRICVCHDQGDGMMEF